MYKQALYLFILFSQLLSCSNKKSTCDPSNHQPTHIESTRYINFKYSKAIAFATSQSSDPRLMNTETLDFSRLHDTISRTLTPSQIQLLDSLLSDPTPEGNTGGANCFVPHHFVAFLDKQNAAVSFIAVCFSCDNVFASRKSVAGLQTYRTFFEAVNLKTFYNPIDHTNYYDSLLALKNQ